jgi:hypothetical protein
MAWPVRPEFFSLYQLWKIWSIFLKNLGEMDIILMLSKFSDQIGTKPECFVFHSTIWPFWLVGACKLKTPLELHNNCTTEFNALSIYLFTNPNNFKFRLLHASHVAAFQKTSLHNTSKRLQSYTLTKSLQSYYYVRLYASID